MNVLLLTIAYPEHGSNIYTDLMEEFKEQGHSVYVVCSREWRLWKSTELKQPEGINVLRVRTGNITMCGVIEKGISTLLIETQFIAAIKKHLRDIKFDLVLYSTPPVTFARVINYIKVRDNAISYLLLKDIFPQNAVDIGMIRQGSLIWRYFRNQEKKLYKLSNYIGCMSPANVAYILRHNPEIANSKVEVCPNSIRPRLSRPCKEKRTETRAKYGIPLDANVFIYGGNLGKPQGIPFLLRVLEYYKCRPEVFFLIVGSGTEYASISRYLTAGRHGNVLLLEYLPKNDYDDLLLSSDIGLIFLDHRFTIPNFPSRLTSYMEASLPIIAATDKHSDVKDMLEASKSGFWSESGDLGAFAVHVERLTQDAPLRQQMGRCARSYLEEYFTVIRSYRVIAQHFTGS